jgi:hypothetical protein
MKSISPEPDRYNDFPLPKKFMLCSAATFVVLRDIRYGLEGKEGLALQAGIIIDDISIIGRWPRRKEGKPKE